MRNTPIPYTENVGSYIYIYIFEGDLEAYA